MIKRVRLENFQTHVDTTVELGRLTVLVGPNGAGKSSVLKALATICREGLGGVSVGPTLIHSLRVDSERFRITAESDDAVDIFWIERRGSDNWAGERERSPAPDSGRFTIPVAHLRMETESLSKPSPMLPTPRIQPDGNGLASVIASMRLRGADELEAIVADLRLVVPQIRDLRVQVVDAGGHSSLSGMAELLVDFVGARGVRASVVSEGTLIAIGLLTVLHDLDSPRLLLLDDIDRGLHPKAQWAFIDIVRRLLERIPDLQIVATTHSPYLVDQLEPDEVRVLALDKRGVTHCRALTEHPDAKALLEVLSTGEMLGSEGEDWVVEADVGD